MFAINKTLTKFAEHKHTNSNQMNTIAQRSISHQEELQQLSLSVYSRVAKFILDVSSNPELIIDLVCRNYCIERSQLVKKSRDQPHTQIRQVLMWYFHKKLGVSQYEASAYFNKGHCTCIHAYKVVENAGKDPLIKYHFDRVMDVIEGRDLIYPENNDSRILSILESLCYKQETILFSEKINRVRKKYNLSIFDLNKIIEKGESIGVLKIGKKPDSGKKTIQFI